MFLPRKVTELKAALGSLGLETKGLKAELVTRLKHHLGGGTRAAASLPVYDPNDPTDDHDQDTNVEVEIIFRSLLLFRVADPKLLISDPDPTFLSITDPEPTLR